MAMVSDGISNASEGSVSVQTEWNAGSNQDDIEAFLIQTKYGAAYWAMTAQFRTARYMARPTIVAGAPYPAIGGFGWWGSRRFGG